jgi:pimeloyl-ACP methyl ester carboxylesterase
MLPDLVLLEIFDLYTDDGKVEAWYTLVHVCQKWRKVVFGSPRRLDLRVLCTANTPVREMLDVWPLLPIVLWSSGGWWGVDNTLAALEHNDRICQLVLTDSGPISLISGFSTLQWKEVLAAMQKPFPALTHLLLQSVHQMAPVDPDLFLGGSAPRLRALDLHCIPFPELPKLLLSATHLVDLYLWDIPYSGYISPEAMVSCLSVLTRLEKLDIGFKHPLSRPDLDSRPPPLPTRTLLPNLTKLQYKGVVEYLEDLVTRIDAPLLDNLHITFFHQVTFNAPQLTELISGTPKFNAHSRARVVFDSDWDNWDTLVQTFDGRLSLGILDSQPDQLSSLAQVFNSSFFRALIPTVDYLYIPGAPARVDWEDIIESIRWVEVLRPFNTVKGVYISRDFAPRIASALQELVGERVTEVLPTLETLFLQHPLPLSSGPVQEVIGQFVAARQLAGLPITVSRWENEVDVWVQLSA